MSSLRPLVTITILAVVGAWLYVKINEGPARPADGEPAAWQDETAEGVPPLVETNAATPTENGAPLPWPAGAAGPAPVAANPAATNPVAPGDPAASTAAGASGLPEMPAIPELPDVASTPEETPSAAAATTPPAALPMNIPQARYLDGSAGNTPTEIPSNPLEHAAPTSPPDPNATTTGSATPPAAVAAADDHEDLSAANSGMARVGLTPQEPPAVQPASNSDRFGTAASVTNPYVTGVAQAPAGPPAAAASPVEPTFAATWPEIQAALDRGELARALELLSKWRGDDSLTPAEAEQVNTLLGQLAGTVVYSNEHQLEPARVVRPGETLDSIATECNVPWQLLAKINGIPTVDAVQLGQQLKVIRGPFSAVVELSRSQLTLMLGGRYAGKFPITVPSGAAVSEGQWLVDQKLVLPSAGALQTSYASAQATVERAIVLKGEEAGTGKPAANGPTLTIASAATPTGPATSPPAIRMSPQDAEELSDILSVGSRIVIQR